MLIHCLLFLCAFPPIVLGKGYQSFTCLKPVIFRSVLEGIVKKQICLKYS